MMSASLKDYKPLDPYKVGPEGYMERVSGANMSLHSDVRALLQELDIFGVIDGETSAQGSRPSRAIEILTIGSDGREEKGPGSPVDVVVLLSRKVREETKAALTEAVEGAVRLTDDDSWLAQRLSRTALFEDVEVKNLKNGYLFRYRNMPGSHGIHPVRLIDAKSLLIQGDALLPKAKKQLLNEVQAHASEIIRAQKSRLSGYRRSTKSGTNSFRGQRLHYTFDEGTAHYNPGEFQFGFKVGPLRLIQTSLARHISHAAQSKNAEWIFDNVPGNTGAKLHFLQANGVIPASFDQTSEIKELYEYFLWLYHRSEFSYRQDGATQTSFDPQLTKENIDNIMALEKEALRVS